MESKLSRWCDGLIEAGWLIAVIGTPLFFNIHSSRVFEPDKLTLLRSIALLMITAWIIKFIDTQGWRSLDWLKWKNPNSIWKMPFVLPTAILVLVYILSSILSVTPFVSWLWLLSTPSGNLYNIFLYRCVCLNGFHNAFSLASGSVS